MTISCTLPEDILGIPLYIPNTYGYFDVEAAALPNGDSCLAVRGDLSNTHKAFMPAPHMSPVDLLYVGDANATGTGRQWAMSCWLKLANLGSTGSGDVMLGCTGEQSNSLYVDSRNQTTPLLLGSAGTNGYQVFRETLNQVASPPQNMSAYFSGSWQGFQNYWFLFVINQLTSAGIAGVTTVMDTYASADAGDNASSGTATSPPAYSVLPKPYLHIGAYHNSGVGRSDIWRIAKWAFHDHVLTQAERQAMWSAMYGAGPFVYADDFNRASLGSNWKALSGASGTPSFDILSNQARAVPTAFKAMGWVRDLGTPKHYAQVSVVSHGSGGFVAPAVRTPNYQASFGGYWGGWQTGSWFIARNGTGFLATAAGTPTLPTTVRLEAETNGSGNVDLRLYADGVLKVSFTDTSGSKILTPTNAGLFMSGSAADALADNFECGTF